MRQAAAFVAASLVVAVWFSPRLRGAQDSLQPSPHALSVSDARLLAAVTARRSACFDAIDGYIRSLK